MDVWQRIDMTQQSRNFATGQLERRQMKHTLVVEWAVGMFKQIMTRLLNSAMQSIAEEMGFD